MTTPLPLLNRNYYTCSQTFSHSKTLLPIELYKRSIHHIIIFTSMAIPDITARRQFIARRVAEGNEFSSYMAVISGIARISLKNKILVKMKT